MDFQSSLNKRNLIILILIIIFAYFAFWMRMIPADGLVSSAGVDLLGNDPWYNLREIELMVNNSLQYPWFDPMTYYPYGTDNFWGPLFPMIASVMCILAGASTRPEIMYVSSFLPPLMAAAMVPVTYFVAERVYNWKAGIVAAFMVSIIGGQYFYRSLFAFVDHHIAEVLFSTLFCLAYIGYLVYVNKHPVDFRDKESFKIPALIAVGSGIAYTLGLYVMPTMALFALLVAIFTGLMFIINSYRNVSSEYIVLVNVITFIVAIAGLFLVGIHGSGTSMARYSMGHVYAYLALICATIILYAIRRILKEKSWHYYLISVIAFGIVAFALIMIAMPEFYNIFISGLLGFFGYSALSTTIEEAQNWSLGSAWDSFDVGIILMILGLCASVLQYIKEKKDTFIFILVWSLLIIYSTTIQLRYEYYLGVNIAVLTGILTACTLSYGWPEIEKILSKFKAEPESPLEEESKQKGKGKKQSKTLPKKQHINSGKLVPLAVVVILIAAGAYVMIPVDINTSEYMKSYGGMTDDWREALEWFGDNSPDTGIDYYTVYNRNDYTNPYESYGVMSWWDYGHWITFISERPPNANPFQEGVAGSNGAAAYFIQQSEEESNAILDNLNTRYVITDAEMDSGDGKFWAMTTWYDPEVQSAPYLEHFLNINDDNSYSVVTFYTPDYYNTMISRLHNFDGSMVDPSQVVYIEYVDGASYGSPYPILTAATMLGVDEAEAKVEEFNSANTGTGKEAAILSWNMLIPDGKVPALQHYRLIHESPTNIFGADNQDLKYVKVFEYVPGAVIYGEGTIKVDLETGTGRQFSYMQESVDGQFIVPYSTTSANGDVVPLGDYTIVETGETFSVSEDAVINGLTIN
ncbi:oligosaccharyl transferase, archaeosortase A system-associated [Methanolacinia paynteri]|uniref:oligosaccharyl transferase, archaeosortase A system-associated n=1 Tax=Methanolacinia paynteri TaxID=230356 RepID=UPI00064FCA19|nr:oligosaccharyl transferase, archaeosortase A system-associated [Methanolacinia paynteri]